MVVKRQLEDVLLALWASIRERRAQYAADPGYVLETLGEVRAGLGLFGL
jgi:tryptophanyl-tRNA synthetase